MAPDAAERLRPLAGRVAVITGSSRNIGRATALALASAGADIVVHGHSNEAAAQATADAVRDHGAKAVIKLCDVTDDDAAERLVDAANTAFGRLDMVICNAAIRRQHPFLEIPLDEFREVMTMDLEAPFRLIQTALPLMMKSNDEGGYGGRIITLGGSSAYVQTPDRSHVMAAKMGLLGLTRCIATEFGEFGITANMVAPGHVDTERGVSAGKRSSGGKNRLIERFAEPEEIAGMIRHLCLPEGAYISGQCLHVDGGTFFSI